VKLTNRILETLIILKLEYFIFLIFGLLMISSCRQGELEIEDKKQPNIVFILTDDLGWNELGFNNPSIPHTSNIDKLHSEGLSLSQFYVHAVCGPSRAAFLTGRYPHRNWMDWRTEDFGKPNYLKMLDMEMAKNDEGEETRRIHALPAEERTIAESLKDLGYFTAIMGKWGCGEWLEEHLPLAQGFMHQFGHYAWGIDYNNYTIPHNAPAKFAVYDWHRNQKPIPPNGYATDLIADEVVDLLGSHKNDYGDQPFFYYIPFNGIHGPLEETPRYGDTLSKRYAALKCLDDAVGRITNALDQNGFTENTLLVFTNDNGAIRDTMNAPFRGTKNTNYEGGVRAPCIIKWPGKIEAKSESDAMVHITDFYSTLTNIAGGSTSSQTNLDGLDMSDVILSGADSPRKEIVFEVGGSVRLASMRKGDFKLVGEELYHIPDDQAEQNDLANIHPAVVIDLKRILKEEAQSRPPLPAFDELMSPALPWVYGQAENVNPPEWLKEHVSAIRASQPQSWPEGKTPWPQPPKDGKIIYLGDGR